MRSSRADKVDRLESAALVALIVWSAVAFVALGTTLVHVHGAETFGTVALTAATLCVAAPMVVRSAVLRRGADQTPDRH